MKKKKIMLVIGLVFFVVGGAVFFVLVKKGEIGWFGKSVEEAEITIESDDLFNLKQDGDEVVIDTGETEMTNDDKEAGFEKERKTEKEVSVGKSPDMPKNILLEVPFSSQAPLGVWDKYHEEACEEASLIMLKYFLDGKKKMSGNEMENEIQKLIKFQIKNYGDYKDSDMKEIVRLADDFYGLKNLKVIYDFKKEDLKKWLAKGNPIIVPTAGRLLGNPYFTPPGPLYHNLLLIGYDNEGNVIANDPGTRRGAGYKYDLNILFDAIHDFPGNKQDIEEGRKAMIVVENNSI